MNRPAVSRREDADFSRHPVALGTAELELLSSGALWWRRERMLIVADLHLEKGSAFATRGRMLPPYDTCDTLARLDKVVEAVRPLTIVALGDSLHDDRAGARLGTGALEALRRLQHGRNWIWITGNHDPEIAPALGGEVAAELMLGQVGLRHIPSETARREADAEIAGHLHPAARISLPGGTVRRRCFASDGRALVLPAFGSFAGGLNVLDEAFAAVLDTPSLAVWMLGDAGVYPVPVGQLTID